MHKMGFVGDNDDAGKIVKVETQILKEEGEHSAKLLSQDPLLMEISHGSERKID